MKHFKKVLLTGFLVATVFAFINATPAKALTSTQIDIIKAQITIIISAITELQKQVTLLKAEEQLANQNQSSVKAITVTAPINGDKWELGKTYNIKWNAPGFGADAKVQIKLIDTRYDINSMAGSLTIAANVSNTGSYNWKIPDLLGGKELYGSLYKISVSIANGNQLANQSDGYFAISKPMPAYIRIISPNGGETLQATKTYTIKWDSLGMENYKVDLVLLRNSFVTEAQLASGIANTGQYSWTIPSNLTGSSYRVQITARDSYNNPIGNDMSDSDFSIMTNFAKKDVQDKIALLAGLIQGITNLLK